MPSEADFQTKFGRWLQYEWKQNGAYELKLTNKKSIPFSAVKDHQVAALKKVYYGGVYYKIPDTGYDKKPFDCFYLEASAYVVIMFYERGKKEFIMIHIMEWLKEIEKSKRKSLTENRAREIGMVKYLK